MVPGSRANSEETRGLIKGTVVQQTHVDGYCISTVQISDTVKLLDQTLSIFQLEDRADLGAPGDYETMVFRHDGETVTDWGELDFARYGTEEAALLGHQAMVEKWANKPKI